MARTWFAAIAVIPVLWFASFAMAAEKTTQQPDACETTKTADEQRCPKKDDAVKLVSHEPSLLGWSYDQSGHGYMDFLLSVKFAIAPASIEKYISRQSEVNFAFSGRYGQYFSRESSPVISKRFNPELFYRHTLQRDDRDKLDSYLDVGYGHESNGQGINSQASYQQAQATLERPEYADENISRGWDYVRFTVRSPRYPGFWKDDCVQAFVTGKRFLGGGVFQGQPDEYNSWENSPEGKPRDEVDGVSVLMKYRHESGLSGWKLAMLYTTGYREIFRYNSVRLEAGVKILQLPVIIWTSHGYNSDLIRYYKNTKAAGVALEIGAF